MKILQISSVFLSFTFAMAFGVILSAQEKQMVGFHEEKTIEEIKTIIEAECKPGMLYFRGKHCGWCDKLEDEVFRNDSARTYIEENFACFACGREIKKEYPIFGVPHTIIIDKEGEVLERIAGYYPIGAFLEKLKRVVQGSSDASARNEVKTFKEAKDVYEADPNNAKAAWDYAQKLFGTGDYGNAIPVYEKLVNLTLDDTARERNKYMNLAFCYESVDRRFIPAVENREKAIEYYRAALEMDLLETSGQKAKVYAKLGKLYFQAGEYEPVIEYLEKLPDDLSGITDVRTKYDINSARMYLPFSHARLGKPEAGKAELEKLFRRTCDNMEYWQLSSYCLNCETYGHYTTEALGWIEKAYDGLFETYESAIKKTTDAENEEERKKLKEEEKERLSGCYQVSYGYEKLLVRNGRFKKAIEILQKGMQLPEGHNSQFYKMGFTARLIAAYIKTGLRDKAEIIMKGLFESAERKSANFYLILAFYEYNTNISDALVMAEDYIKDDSKNYWIVNAYAGLLYESGEIAKAVEWEKKAIGLMPEDKFFRNLEKYKAALKEL